MPSTNFLTFRKFADQDYAKAFTGVLERLDIPYDIESSAPLNPVEVNVGREYYIKIKGVDFLRANGAIKEFYAEQVQHAEVDYYLFSFSEEELKEVLDHPDEWSDYDYALTVKILKDKGVHQEERTKTVVTEDQSSIHKKREERRFTEENLMSGIIGSLAGGFMGIWKGWMVLNDKIILPNGEEDYAYPEPDRKRGGTLFVVGGVIFFAYVLISILLLYRSS